MPIEKLTRWKRKQAHKCKQQFDIIYLGRMAYKECLNIAKELSFPSCYPYMLIFHTEVKFSGIDEPQPPSWGSESATYQQSKPIYWDCLGRHARLRAFVFSGTTILSEAVEWCTRPRVECQDERRRMQSRLTLWTPSSYPIYGRVAPERGLSP